MKKQILFLTFLSLAFVFAGMNQAFGQTPGGAGRTDSDYATEQYLSGAATCIAPATLTSCEGTEVGPLNPVVGQPYTYEVVIRNALTTTGGGNIHWYVTTDVNLFTAMGVQNTANIDPGTGLGSYIMESSTSYDIAYADDPNNFDNTVTIKWKSFDGATTPVLLVAYVVDDAGCTDNIEVYRIQPQFNFALEIAALTDNAGTITAHAAQTNTAEECVSPIELATYDATNDELTVDYGENWVFFIVNAVNFVDSWMPTFQLNYDGTFADIEADWAYLNQASSATGVWNDLTTTETASPFIFASAVPVIAGGANAADGTTVNNKGGGIAADANGECIVVRVRVDHGTDTAAENDEDGGNKTVRLAVNGIMYDAGAQATADEYTNTAYEDLHDAGSTTGCITDGYDNDWVNYILTPRPAVASDTDDGTGTPVPFEDKNGSVNTVAGP